MGLFDNLLGKKKFCSVCGAIIADPHPNEVDGDLFCSDRCRDTLERLSLEPSRTLESTLQTPEPADVFGLPEVTVYVFRSNDPSPFYALQERIIQTYCEPGLRVSRLDGDDVALVAVAGPVGSLGQYRKALRKHLGTLAKEANVRPERMRPNATYTNVAETGAMRSDDPAIRAVCSKIQRGVFRPVFSGPPSVPPSSSAPVLRAMSDDLLIENAVGLVERHVSFFPGGVVKVESDGVNEAALLFGELARRRALDPEPAYLEAAAYFLATRRDAAQARLDTLLRTFPDHLESRLLAATGKSVLSYPRYEDGLIPASLRERTHDVAIVMTRRGRAAQPVMFVDLRGRPAPQDPCPVAHPVYEDGDGIPIVGVAVVFAGPVEQRFEAIVAGFEEHDGGACAAPRACYLFRAPKVPVVCHESDRPVFVTEATFEPGARDTFVRCEDRFRQLPPRAFAVEELGAALDNYHRAHPLDDVPSTRRERRL